MIEKYLDGTKEQFAAFMELPIDGPLKMLNLLKFKNIVTETGKTGAETYKDYMNAALPFFSKVNVKITFSANTKLSMIGPFEKEWDKVLIVEYASKQDFISMVTMEGYPTDLRIAALEDSRLLFCQ